ncbi:MAG: hypothetical protein JXB85_12865 [Anaerolineales bacterium]|nr:hypothetical protein [Anaerolineales bacterium]
MITPYECSQCGSTNFEKAGARRVRCAHCGSLFQVLTDDPALTIVKGANVVFEKSARVEIYGDVEIENGAHVNIEGQVTLLKGQPKKKFELRLLQAGNRPPRGGRQE